MLTLVLTRHGLTPRSVPEQHLGQRLDIGLAEAGRAEASALAARLAGVRFERVISSPLMRAMETARLLASGREIEPDPRLLEMAYGAWEGLTYQQIDARDGAARRLWEADPAGLACPGGESGGDVALRIRAFLEATIEAAGSPADTADHLVLAVAHSTTNRILLCVALGVAVRDYRRRFVQDPANLTVLRFARPRGSGAQALVVNDVSHLGASAAVPWAYPADLTARPPHA
ncbi:MAG: histidine phosphatase family protein [Candidatus Limnocylindrales bacterium]